MGKKRVTGLVEITFPADEPRTVEELKLVSRNAMEIGLSGDNGTLAAFAVTSAFTEPDPEPSFPDAPDVPPVTGGEG